MQCDYEMKLCEVQNELELKDEIIKRKDSQIAGLEGMIRERNNLIEELNAKVLDIEFNWNEIKSRLLPKGTIE